MMTSIKLILANCEMITIKIENIEDLDYDTLEKEFLIKVKNTKETEYKHSDSDLNTIYDGLMKYKNIKAFEIHNSDNNTRTYHLPYEADKKGNNKLQQINYDKNDILTISIKGA